MGNSIYDSASRSVRTTYYASATRDAIFTQSASRTIHPEMNPMNVAFRESRDSEAHPLTIPIQLYLDVTGSMGHIPHEMIKDGLPTLMSALIQNGVKDAALMFGAIGDHECDRYPLQIGQFESGDKELDLWLTRSFLEGGGGSNAGESYLLAWYFAALHTRTDAFEKRGKKGFVFTVGDEPCLTELPVSAVKQVMGTTAVGQNTYSILELLHKAEEKNYVYHVHVEHGGRDVPNSWRQLLGDKLIIINDPKHLAKTISDIILSHESMKGDMANIASKIEDVINPDSGKEPENLL